MSATKYNALSGPSLTRKKLARGAVCRSCGAQVSLAHASLHAWQEHHRAIGPLDLGEHFTPVKA